MSDKKIIIIDFGKISTPYCGLAEVALNYAQALEGLKSVDLEFIYIVPKPLLSKFYKQVGVKAISPKYSGFNRLCYYLSGQRHFLCHLPEFDLYHYIHFYSPWGPKANASKPVLLTVHDLHALERKRSEKRLRRKLSEVSHVAFISKFAAQEYATHFASLGKQTRIIMNGVKIPPVVDENSSDKWKQKYSDFLFTIGGLKRKNIHSLLGMIDKNNHIDTLKDLKLVVAGGIKTKYKKELLTEIEKRGIQQKVIFLGSVSEQDKYELMHACRAFVFPSLQEGFGLPIIEALHFGKPVFCSNKTSLPEVGGEMVYYWEKFDAEYMSSVLQHGLQDDIMHEAKSSERKKYAYKFNWNINAQQYMEYYSQILG
ncbi:MAG: glycosyltransferase family 1 protein [Gammaproteobacteria bacterium]|nr:glycosyltransferase family 1 protein [Gammaproteobacteria bacterium]